MNQKEKVWWVSATVLSLAGFAFFAGLGMRGLFDRLTGRPMNAASVLNGYPRVASADPRVGAEPDMRPRELYLEVLRKLQLYYVETLPSDTQLAYGSVDAMLNSLKDPNTRLLSKAEADALQSASTGEFPGLGAVLTIKQHQRTDKSNERLITVVSVIPGGPAEKAGLLAGDRITEVDGHWVAPAHISYRVLTQLTDSLGPQDYRPRDPSEEPEEVKPDPERDKQKKEADEARARWKNATDMSAAMKALLGEEKGEHELTIERGKPAKVSKVKVTLGTTTVPLVSSRKLNDSTGYLKVLALSAGSLQQAGDVLGEFQKSGVKNLVLDLRGSPGGSLEAARDLAGMLMGDGKFAVLKQRDAKRQLVDQPMLVKGASVRFKPASLSILVDSGTSSSAEVLAAALRENLGAKLVGATTFGDGTEQELVRLDNGSGISITRAKMLTSKGEDFDGKGLKADVTPQGDPLDAAVKALAQANRPAVAVRG